MITFNQGKNVPRVMKLSHFIRYYEQRPGVRLPPEMVDPEDAKEGVVLGRWNEAIGPRLLPRNRTTRCLSRISR
jgi:hypothetical protein